MTSHSIVVAPSILACDFGNLHAEVRRAEAAGGDWLHLDVMDGHFVDNISFGPAFCEAAAKVATVPLDVHLMIQRPDHYFSRFVAAAANITIHVETGHHLERTLAAIRAAGRTCGLALNPATPLSAVARYLNQIDLLLVMTVVPGFGGQSFIKETLTKVEEASRLRAEKNWSFRIEVDGGVNLKTSAECIAAGADTLVVGTSAFHAPDMGAAIAAMRGTSA